jgi:ankyrin repeat protein
LGASVNKLYYYKGEQKTITDYVTGRTYTQTERSYWYTLLANVAKLGEVEAIKVLLKLGAIAHQKADGKLPIYFTTNQEIKDILKERMELERKTYYSYIAKKKNKQAMELYQYGLEFADSILINEDNKYYTPVEFSIRTGNEQFACFLVEKGLDVLNKPFLTTLASKKNMNKLSVVIDSATRAQKAVVERAKNEKNIKEALYVDNLQLYKQSVSLIKNRSTEEMSKDLLKACRYSSYEIAKFIVEQGVKIEDKHFEEVIRSNKPQKITELFVKNGVDVSIDLLKLACHLNRGKVIEIFIKQRFNPKTVIGEEKHNLISYIAKHRYSGKRNEENIAAISRTIVYLVKAGVDINQVMDANKTIPLHQIIIKQWKAELVETFVENGADINYRGQYYKTALMHAIEKSNLSAAEYLISTGKVDLGIKDISNKTAKDYLEKKKLEWRGLKTFAKRRKKVIELLRMIK